MGGGGSFGSIFQFSLFCTGVWCAGAIFLKFGVNDQVPTILAGVGLGPYGFRVLPDTYAICRAKETMSDENLQHISDINAIWGCNSCKCKDTNYLTEENFATTEACIAKKKMKARVEACMEYPDVFTIVGHLGVSLLIFRAGLHFDPYGSAEVLKESTIHGFLGTAFPLAMGYAFVKFWFDKEGTEPGLSAWAVGVSLSPTSIGMALKLLLDSGVAATEFGQGIIMGSLIDDIFALGAFEVLVQAVEGDGSVKAQTIAKSMLGFVFCFGGVVLSLVGFKPLIEKPAFAIHKKYPPGNVKDDFGNDVRTNFPAKDQFIIFMMFVVVIAMSKLTGKFGSHLWGCFAAGIMFAPVTKALRIWRYQTKKLQAWFLRFFFAGSVGFALNVEALMDQEAIWKGAVMGLVAAIGGKHLAGFWLGDSVWVVGWAMTCRAEFAYMVAQICFWKGMMSEKMFSITLWALFWATVAGPIGFQYSLSKMRKRGSHELEIEASANARLKPQDADSYDGAMNQLANSAVQVAPKPEPAEGDEGSKIGTA